MVKKPPTIKRGILNLRNNMTDEERINDWSVDVIQEAADSVAQEIDRTIVSDLLTTTTSTTRAWPTYNAADLVSIQPMTGATRIWPNPFYYSWVSVTGGTIAPVTSEPLVPDHNDSKEPEKPEETFERQLLDCDSEDKWIHV